MKNLRYSTSDLLPLVLVQQSTFFYCIRLSTSSLLTDDTAAQLDDSVIEAGSLPTLSVPRVWVYLVLEPYRSKAVYSTVLIQTKASHSLPIFTAPIMGSLLPETQTGCSHSPHPLASCVLQGVPAPLLDSTPRPPTPHHTPLGGSGTKFPSGNSGLRDAPALSPTPGHL